MSENGMSWKNVHCEVKGHGSFVAGVVVVGHNLHSKKRTKVVEGYEKMTGVDERDVNVDDWLEVVAHNRYRSCLYLNDTYIDRRKT